MYLREKLHPNSSQFLDSQTAKRKYEELQILGFSKTKII
jgi:hypothetical protein